MNNFKQFNQINGTIRGIIFVVICIIFVIIVIVPSVRAHDEQSVLATDNNINVHTIYIRGNDGAVIQRKFSLNGSVTIGHSVDIVSGSTTMCVDENINFEYDPSFTFTAGNGAWDTPYGKWVNSINQDRTSEIETNTYWQRFYDTGGGGRWGRIAWSAVKPLMWNGSGSSAGKVYMTSSNNNVVRCTGMQCVAIGDGNATITAHFPAVTTRMWTWARFSKPTPNGSSEWISEHWERPGSVDDIKPNWMFCPTVRTPSNNSVNYCANRLVLPAQTVAWAASVGVPARCDYCGDGVLGDKVCDTSAGSTPKSCALPDYGESCTYCVAPGDADECTWKSVHGPYCGDGEKNGTEDCDNGTTGEKVRNGLPCIAEYGENCEYCSNSCTNVTEVGPFCGDGKRDFPQEECDIEDNVPENAHCESDCTLTYEPTCGDWEENNSDDKPVNGSPYTLCGTNCTDTTSPYMIANGDWNWICTYDVTKPASPRDIDCETESCLSGLPINLQRYVYFDSDGKANNAVISVHCPNVCCEIDGQLIDIGEEQKNFICTGEEGELKVNNGSNLFDAKCWRKDDENIKVPYDNLPVNTMCTARECNTQGTCQATPQAGDSPDACTSTCNSNADCSRGRIIETRP